MDVVVMELPTFRDPSIPFRGLALLLLLLDPGLAALDVQVPVLLAELRLVLFRRDADMVIHALNVLLE